MSFCLEASAGYSGAGPVKFFAVPEGRVADACDVEVFVWAELASLFAFGFECFTIGLADASGAGASEIGAGSRCALDASRKPTSAMCQAALIPHALERRSILRNNEPSTSA